LETLAPIVAEVSVGGSGRVRVNR